MKIQLLESFARRYRSYISRTLHVPFATRERLDPKEMIGRHLNSDTAENSERGNPRWGEGDRVVVSVAESVRAGFAVSCRIGWLISHSHDYIDEMEGIYIRARTGAEGVWLGPIFRE